MTSTVHLLMFVALVKVAETQDDVQSEAVVACQKMVDCFFHVFLSESLPKVKDLGFCTHGRTR